MKEDDGAILAAIQQQHDSWLKIVPGNPAELWKWCLDQSQDRLLSLQAFLVAQSVNAVDFGDSYNKSGIEHGKLLGQTLNVDMSAYFKPTPDNYFKRLKLDGIRQIVSDVCGAEIAQPIAGMSKKEAAAYAQKKINGMNWIPEPLRLFEDDDTASPLPVAAE
ncbi:hypothetical protein E1297_01740 [Roseibium sp. RKSG952]|nr:hypothetical protein [Roseibium sp. RKSG952]